MISDLDVKQLYSGDGATATFAIPFDFIKGNYASEVKVYVVSYDADGVASFTLKTLGALQDYQLTPAYDSGNPTAGPNNVVFNASHIPAADEDVLVIRTLPLTQPISIANGPLLLSNIEKGLDQLCRLIQQINEQVDRAIKLPKNMTSADLSPEIEIPTDVADRMLQFSPDGTDLVLGPTRDELQAAIDAAAAAATSAADAAASQAAAAASAASVSSAATNAAASATSAAASAAAAAASAAASVVVGYLATGPFSVTENSNSNLSGETTDHTLFTQVDFVARIVRGTTVFASQGFSIFYRNGAWEIALELGVQNESAANHGVTFTVDSTTGQINAAVDNSGAGNATITLKKLAWAA
jgi:hypothetical protein